MTAKAAKQARWYMQRCITHLVKYSLGCDPSNFQDKMANEAATSQLGCLEE